LKFICILLFGASLHTATPELDNSTTKKRRHKGNIKFTGRKHRRLRLIVPNDDNALDLVICYSLRAFRVRRDAALFCSPGFAGLKRS
jgi:hypothetical protein